MHQGDIRLRNDVAIDRARQLVVSGSGFGVCSGSVVSLSNCDPEGRQDDGNAQDMIPFPRGRMHPPELSPFDGGFLLKVPCPGIPREDIRVELVGNRTVCVQQLAHSTAYVEPAAATGARRTATTSFGRLNERLPVSGERVSASAPLSGERGPTSTQS